MSWTEEKVEKLKDSKYNNPNIVDPSLVPIIENLNPSII